MVIKYPINKELHPDVTGTCQICGTARSGGYWMAVGVGYEVCGNCAVEKLPLLIADAIALGPSNETALAEQALEKVKAAFWRGMAIRLSRPKTDQEGG